jgi:hypothetical protein
MRFGSGFAPLVIALALGLGLGSPAHSQSAPLLDSNGWTVVTPSSDTVRIYVSNSTGNDVNNGRSSTTPVKTIQRGLSLLRSGYPDWLLLNKGDTWTNETFNFLCVSGRSAAEPILLSSYGVGARPLLKTNADFAIGSFGGGCSGGKGDFIALIGIEFYAYTRDPSSPAFVLPTTDQLGTRFLNPITWMLIEDCKFSFYAYNIDFDASSTGPSSLLSLRRNVIVDAYSNVSTKSQGVYIDGIANRLYEENLLDHNGWNASVPNAAATVYSRNLYDQFTNKPGILPNGPAIFRGNISTRSAAEGAQIRPGGTVTNNLFVRNPVGFAVGASLSAGAPTISNATVSNNVVLEANDISAAAPRGMGLSIDNMTNSTVRDNIIAHSASGNPTNVYGAILDPANTSVVVTSNIMCDLQNAPTVIWDQGTGNTTSGNILKGADCNQLSLLDPSRTLASYDAAVLGGPGTLEHFVSLARQQSKDSWNPAVTATAVNQYIRAGYTLTSAPTPDSTGDTVAPSAPGSVSGQLVSSTQANVWWAASSDNVGVAGYNIFRNGIKIGTTSATSYQDVLFPGGNVAYNISAYDTAGNTSALSASFTVASVPTASVTAPVVKIVSPGNGSILDVKNSVTVSVSATDAKGIASISVNVDGSILSTCTGSGTCSATWQNKKLTQGTHSIKATATNNSGMSSTTSSSILVLR